MILTVEELIKVLRESVNVQTGEEEVIDPLLLTMSDEDLSLFLKLAVSRAYPQCSSLIELPEGADYPVVLLAKIELFLKLAVTKADKVDMGVDNNNYLKNDQRFQHYMKLVSATKEQYDSWLENEGQGEVSTFDVLLDKNHYTQRNYELQNSPRVSLVIDLVTADSVDFHWNVSGIRHFGCYEVYVSDNQIFDVFRGGTTYKANLCEGAKRVVKTSNLRLNHHRITQLASEKTYYLAVVSVERNQVYGVAEVAFDTLPEFQEEEDEIIEELPDNNTENNEEEGGEE